MRYWKASLAVLFSLIGGCASLPPVPPMQLVDWPAQAPEKGVIVALHSFGDHSVAFDDSAPKLAAAGYAVYAYDQAGFGHRDLNGRWAGEHRLVSDAARAVALVARRHPGKPLYLLGESLGGAVAMLAVTRHPELPVRGLILAAPAVREGIRLRYGWNLLITSAATVAPGYRLTVNRPADDPTLTPAAARRLHSDPLVMRKVRVDTYWGLIKLADSASDEAPEIDRPTLLLYGGEDHSVPAVSIHRLREHLKDEVVYHFYPDEPHLLLQGRHWQKVTGDMIRWLNRETAAKPLAGATAGGVHAVPER